MQKWEYRTFRQNRDFKGSRLGAAIYADEWDQPVAGRLEEWGKDGWELVSVVAQCDIGGDQWAGITTARLWLFKKPVE